MSRLRGLLPGLLLIVVLPLTVLLVVLAVGATTLHQNEMRSLIAQHDRQAAHQAATALDERIRHLTSLDQSSIEALGLAALTDTFGSSPRVRALIVDSGARVVHDSSGTLPGSDAASEAGVAKALRGQDGVTFNRDEQGVEWVVAYAPVPSAGWALILAEPWEDVVNPLLRTSLLIPLALVPAMLIALVAIVFGVRRVIRPLQQLDRQAVQAGQGRYDALAQPVEGIAEIQTLQATLVQMTGQIRSYQRSIQSYAAAVARSQEDERARLARELHDETVQALIALNQRVQMVERALARDPKVAADKLVELRAMTASALEDVRRVIRALRPVYLEELGLVPALETLTRGIGQAGGLNVDFAVDGEPRRLAPERELAVFRIVQEALSNVVNHAQARHAQVELTYTDALMVSITDDGVGFTVPERLEALTDGHHFGLVGLRERAELIGAKLTIRSAPGAGTTIALHLPLQA